LQEPILIPALFDFQRDAGKPFSRFEMRCCKKLHFSLEPFGVMQQGREHTAGDLQKRDELLRVNLRTAAPRRRDAGFDC
jgi:hypothetical protein